MNILRVKSPLPYLHIHSHLVTPLCANDIYEGPLTVESNIHKAHDRSKEFHWKFNRPVAAKMIQLQNPLLRFHKTTKGNFSGEDFQISPTVSFLDDSDSLAQIMPYSLKAP